MHEKKTLLNRIKELEELLEMSERKSDILTNLLKEASAEFEQALEKITISESNFRAIFENAPEAIYIIDTDTRQILDCNPFLLSWLGYSRSELLSMKVEDILEPGTQGVQENIQRAVKNGVVHIQERQFKKKDGIIVDAEVTGTVLKYQEKKCFVALIRDITERKQIEELGRYKELFGNVSDPVFINDSKGIFLEINDVACECLGYSREEMLQMRVRDVRKPGQDRIVSEITKKIQKGETVQFELEMMHRKGEVIPFEFHSHLISYGGIPAVLSVGRNLSVRKKMEETLIRSERLKALGEMAGGVAHNFNNLLQMIMGAGEAALSKITSGKIRECSEAVESIVNASRRGADIVRRIKDFTIVKTDEFSETKIFDLGELVTEVVQISKPLWKNVSEHQRYWLNYIRYPGCFMNGKPSEIYEVLVNLVKNALEAMPYGGPITIATCIHLGKIYLTVSDKGQGIQEQDLPRIFDPFFTTKGLKNSGLGLASSYGIIKKHQGEIYAESILNQGTTFTLILPLSQRFGEEYRKKTEPSQYNTHIRFLLIDDEINILRAMKLFFEDSEIEILTAHTAEKGLEFVFQGRIDVILCDLSMDDMDGWEMGKRIKEFCESQKIPKIPFLLYTGLIRQLDIKKLEQSGVDRVITKPVPYDELKQIIQEMIE